MRSCLAYHTLCCCGGEFNKRILPSIVYLTMRDYRMLTFFLSVTLTCFTVNGSINSRITHAVYGVAWTLVVVLIVLTIVANLDKKKVISIIRLPSEIKEWLFDRYRDTEEDEEGDDDDNVHAESHEPECLDADTPPSNALASPQGFVLAEPPAARTQKTRLRSLSLSFLRGRETSQSRNEHPLTELC